MFSLHRQPGEQREILKHHAALRPGRGDRRPVHLDGAGGRRLESGDDAQQRRLAAARRADQADEFAFADREIDVAQCLDRLLADREALGEPLDGERRPRAAVEGRVMHDAAGSSASRRLLIATIMRSDRKPASPITIMPEITRSVRDSVRPSMITAPRPSGTPVISPTTISIHAKPCPRRRPLKIAGGCRRQHDLAEQRRAVAAEHRGGLEQPVVDRAHAEDGVEQDRIETRRGTPEKSPHSGPSPKKIIESGSHAVTGIGRSSCSVGSNSCAHDLDAADQQPQRDADCSAAKKPP